MAKLTSSYWKSKTDKAYEAVQDVSDLNSEISTALKIIEKVESMVEEYEKETKIHTNNKDFGVDMRAAAFNKATAVRSRINDYMKLYEKQKNKIKDAFNDLKDSLSEFP